MLNFPMLVISEHEESMFAMYIAYAAAIMTMVAASKHAMTPEGEGWQEVHLAQDWAAAPGTLGEQHLGHPQLLAGPPLQSAATDNWAAPAAVMANGKKHYSCHGCIHCVAIRMSALCSQHQQQQPQKQQQTVQQSSHNSGKLMRQC